MKVSRYHKFLRTSLIIVLGVLLFDGGFIFPVTKQLSRVTTTYLASVGAEMYVSVPENEFNTLTAQISEQQKLLDAREKAIQEREIASRPFGADSQTNYSTFILSAILFVLTVLIVINYIMDWVRVRKNVYA